MFAQFITVIIKMNLLDSTATVFLNQEITIGFGINHFASACYAVLAFVVEGWGFQKCLLLLPLLVIPCVL
jgi:hypothetical protein